MSILSREEVLLMRDKTCCFSGHRDIDAKAINEVKRRLRYTLTDLISKGYRYFGAGGARGFDTLAAFAVLELKKVYPHIRLILVYPCKDQTKGWNDDDKKKYEYLKSHCDKYVYVSEEYTKGCMHKRNRRLADNSSVCVCYLNKQSGGTAYTVNYAKQNGLRIINIAEGD